MALWLHDKSRFMTHDIMIYNDTIMIKHSNSNMFACRLYNVQVQARQTFNMWYMWYGGLTLTLTRSASCRMTVSTHLRVLVSSLVVSLVAYVPHLPCTHV